MWSLVTKLFKVLHVVVYQFELRDQGPHEVFAVIFDNFVCLHGVVESNKAPELSFDFRRIHFRAITISTMRNYLSKNSHTHQMKINETKRNALHVMSVHVMVLCCFQLLSIDWFLL